MLTKNIKPEHYTLIINNQESDVNDIIEAISDKLLAENKHLVTFYQFGCVKEMLQYAIRSPFKDNFVNDIEKVKNYAEIILESRKRGEL